jgi:hypothetical protein
MNPKLSHAVAFLVVLVAALSGCATLERRHVFHTPLADADIDFEVVDRRGEAGREFVASGAYPQEYRYADDQFVRPPVRVVASYIAAASRPQGDAPLVIDRLDIVNRVRRPLGDFPNVRLRAFEAPPQVVVAFNLAVILARAASVPGEGNSVTSTLSGTYGDRPFSVSRRVVYDKPWSREHANAADAALRLAIRDAIAQIGAKDRTPGAWDRQYAVRRDSSAPPARVEPDASARIASAGNDSSLAELGRPPAPILPPAIGWSAFVRQSMWDSGNMSKLGGRSSPLFAADAVAEDQLCY